MNLILRALVNVPEDCMIIAVACFSAKFGIFAGIQRYGRVLTKNPFMQRPIPNIARECMVRVIKCMDALANSQSAAKEIGT